ncbi:MAG: DUF305 domain-containing protein [Gemmatimonadaceae bacterium]
MKRPSRRLHALPLAAIICIAACRARPAVQHEPARVSAPETRPDAGRRRHTAADTRFVQDMIAHHGQALAMTALVPARTTRTEMRLLAERIDVSQRDEIALMRQWLEQRGEQVPSVTSGHEHHAAAGHQMPSHGMLTAAEMTQLANATGTGFERLFLQLMIRHHEGALRMVAELFGTPGAAQEPETYRLATDVDADQRAEIARMRALLQR